MRNASVHPGARLNLLLSYGGWREHAAVRQLPRLLEPMGICALEADTCEEAASLIQHQPVHIAVVDLEIPLSHTGQQQTPGGARILQLLRRLDQPPPTIVVRPRQANNRQDVRELLASLREGAFAVIDRPLQLETILDTLRRVLRRHYQDAWPPMR
jgi:DNA-binding response OmpR family regulator